MDRALAFILMGLVGYGIGSIPVGYLVVRFARGIDIRDYGSHNIGFTNVLRVVGLGPGLITLAGDVLKGLLPTWWAAVVWGGRGQPWPVVAAALGAMLGHAYSAYFYARERRFTRGKSVATGIGALVGMALGHQIPWAGVILPAVMWAGVVFGPWLTSGRFGFVSLASILAAITVPVVLLLAGAAPPYLLFSVAAASFVAWKHKENFFRLLDGVEPRFGERVPVPAVDRDIVVCGFMIHPLTFDDFWQPRRFGWMRTLARYPLVRPAIDGLRLRIRPMKLDVVEGIRLADGRRVHVYLFGAPLLPEEIRRMPALAVKRAVQAARLAQQHGAKVLGLGAYWSVVGNKGEEVARQVPDLAITNGGAYTAGAVKLAIPQMLARLRERGKDPLQARVAVVGANGVVGFGICRQLAGQVGTLVMVGHTPERLARAAETIRRRFGIDVETATDLAVCRTCDLIFTATSNPEPVLFPEHVRPHTILYDLGRPADVHPDVLDVEGVLVVPGGVIRPPGEVSGRLDIHFGRGAIPACMAETILIAADAAYDRVSLGDRTASENIDYFVRRGEELGFRLVEQWEPVREPPAATAVAPVRVAS